MDSTTQADTVHPGSLSPGKRFPQWSGVQGRGLKQCSAFHFRWYEFAAIVADRTPVATSASCAGVLAVIAELLEDYATKNFSYPQSLVIQPLLVALLVKHRATRRQSLPNAADWGGQLSCTLGTKMIENVPLLAAPVEQCMLEVERSRLDLKHAPLTPEAGVDVHDYTLLVQPLRALCTKSSDQRRPLM